MRWSHRLFAVAVGGSLALTLSFTNQAEPSTAAYVGAGKCKLCHNSPAKGAQYTRWAGTKHANAYKTLASERAKEFATAKGVANPQKAPECLKCHVTAQGAPEDKLIGKYTIEDGVGCESCHGPGGDYWKMAVMKDRTKALAAGMMIPDERTCRGCHNAESPSYKEFDYETFAAKIAHPNPQKAAEN